jgi:Carboxypeptidase regulatory-like domain
MATATIAIWAGAAIRVSAQSAGNVGVIEGCVTDQAGRGLPGATIAIGQGERRWRATSDARGCYSVAGLASGTYFVFAKLQAFVTVARDRVIVAAHERQAIDFTLRIAPICDCVLDTSLLRRMWDMSDAVVHVRIVSHDPTRPELPHVATVLNSWKSHPHVSPGATLTFRQFLERSEVAAYAVNQEVFLFLRWSGADNYFIRNASGPDTITIWAFAIENSEVSSAPDEAYLGMSTSGLQSMLSKVAQQTP